MEKSIKIKHCPSCDKIKLIEEFNTKNSSIDNKARCCRDCSNSAKRIIYWEKQKFKKRCCRLCKELKFRNEFDGRCEYLCNKCKENLKLNNEKFCNGCDSGRAIVDFHRHAGTKDGLEICCNKCTRDARFRRKGKVIKKCRICKITKSHTEFIGGQRGCKNCVNQLKELKQKFCPDCDSVKPIEDFYKCNNTEDGFKSVCAKCSLEKNRFRKKNKLGHFQYENRRYAHKLTIEQVNEVMGISDVCEICGKKVYLCIDHCHQTGQIRGLLCQRCNTALAAFGETPELLFKAINYLNKGNRFNFISKHSGNYPKRKRSGISATPLV